MSVSKRKKTGKAEKVAVVYYDGTQKYLTSLSTSLASFFKLSPIVTTDSVKCYYGESLWVGNFIPFKTKQATSAELTVSVQYPNTFDGFRKSGIVIEFILNPELKEYLKNNTENAINKFIKSFLKGYSRDNRQKLDAILIRDGSKYTLRITIVPYYTFVEDIEFGEIRHTLELGPIDTLFFPKENNKFNLIKEISLLLRNCLTFNDPTIDFVHCRQHIKSRFESSIDEELQPFVSLNVLYEVYPESDKRDSKMIGTVSTIFYCDVLPYSDKRSISIEDLSQDLVELLLSEGGTDSHDVELVPPSMINNYNSITENVMYGRDDVMLSVDERTDAYIRFIRRHAKRIMCFEPELKNRFDKIILVDHLEYKKIAINDSDKTYNLSEISFKLDYINRLGVFTLCLPDSIPALHTVEFNESIKKLYTNLSYISELAKVAFRAENNVAYFDVTIHWGYDYIYIMDKVFECLSSFRRIPKSIYSETGKSKILTIDSQRIADIVLIEIDKTNTMVRDIYKYDSGASTHENNLYSLELSDAQITFKVSIAILSDIYNLNNTFKVCERFNSLTELKFTPSTCEQYLNISITPDYINLSNIKFALGRIKSFIEHHKTFVLLKKQVQDLNLAHRELCGLNKGDVFPISFVEFSKTDLLFYSLKLTIPSHFEFLSFLDFTLERTKYVQSVMHNISVPCEYSEMQDSEQRWHDVLTWKVNPEELTLNSLVLDLQSLINIHCNDKIAFSLHKLLDLRFNPVITKITLSSNLRLDINVSSINTKKLKNVVAMAVKFGAEFTQCNLVYVEGPNNNLTVTIELGTIIAKMNDFSIFYSKLASLIEWFEKNSDKPSDAPISPTGSRVQKSVQIVPSKPIARDTVLFLAQQQVTTQNLRSKVSSAIKTCNLGSDESASEEIDSTFKNGLFFRLPGKPPTILNVPENIVNQDSYKNQLHTVLDDVFPFDTSEKKKGKQKLSDSVSMEISFDGNSGAEDKNDDHRILTVCNKAWPICTLTISKLDNYSIKIGYSLSGTDMQVYNLQKFSFIEHRLPENLRCPVNFEHVKHNWTDGYDINNYDLQPLVENINSHNPYAGHYIVIPKTIEEVGGQCPEFDDFVKNITEPYNVCNSGIHIIQSSNAFKNKRNLIEDSCAYYAGREGRSSRPQIACVGKKSFNGSTYYLWMFTGVDEGKAGESSGSSAQHQYDEAARINEILPVENRILQFKYLKR